MVEIEDFHFTVKIKDLHPATLASPGTFNQQFLILKKDKNK